MSSSTTPETPSGAPPDTLDGLAVRLDDLAVCYRLPAEPVASLKEYAIRWTRGGIRQREFWALRGVDLSVRRGEVLGLIGANGSGKSTLLKVVARVIHPTHGRVRVRGRVSPLIELGAGFNDELTGRENIFLKSAVLGFSRRDTAERIDRIVAFAGLEAFVDAPLRTYSSGMVARLGFAVATDVQPEILIVDEILSVGDAEFQQRSADRIRQFRERGTTILIVAHQLAALQSLCDQVAWLAHGQIVERGPAAAVTRSYQRRYAPGADLRRIVRLADPLQESEIGPSDSLLIWHAPTAGGRALGAIAEEQFAAAEIAPAALLSRTTTEAVLQASGYRLLSGFHPYERAAALLGEASIGVAVLADPAEHAAATVALLRSARPSGQPAPVLGGLDEYLADPRLRPLFSNAQTSALVSSGEPLRREIGPPDLERAIERLDRCALIGISDQPELTAALAAFVFGWRPPEQLRRVPLPDTLPGDRALVAAVNQYDTALYQHARARFTERVERMEQTLLARYPDSAWRGLALPLPEPVLLQLLDRHYADRYTARYTPTHELRLTFDQPVSAAGWYPTEQNQQHGPFRWSGPNTRASFDLPLADGRALTFSLGILMTITPEVRESLAISVNGMALNISGDWEPGGILIVSGLIPAEALALRPGLARIELRVGETVAPNRIDPLNQDARRLGVAVAWVRVTPA